MASNMDLAALCVPYKSLTVKTHVQRANEAADQGILEASRPLAEMFLLLAKGLSDQQLAEVFLLADLAKCSDFALNQTQMVRVECERLNHKIAVRTAIARVTL